MNPVETIKTDDFLVQKNDGDVVTGSDWNKLVALFHATNSNALALLDVIKNVDTNTANIAQVTQGAVPDGSIGSSKLEKYGGIKNVYVFTEDTTPQAGTTYFTLKDGAYVPHADLVAFTPGEQYYVLATVPTTAAVSDSNAVGNNVVTHYHCVDAILGGLLNDKTTVYTDKGVTGVFEACKLSDAEYNAGAIPTQTRTITFSKPHKAFLIITSSTISLLLADSTKPDIHFGMGVFWGDKDIERILIHTLIGEDKRTEHIQSIADIGGEGTALDFYKMANADRVALTHCYYDAATQSIKLEFKHAYYDHDSYDKIYTFNEENYSFGNLIIGL
jgi:hypothetical protein